MSIVNMKRVAFIGLDTEKKKLMSQLMDFGAVELTEQSAKLADSYWAENTAADDNQETVTAIEAKISEAAQALEVIDNYGNLKAPLLKTRRTLPESEYAKIAARESEAEKDIKFILGLNDGIRQAADNYNRLTVDMTSLTPWADYDAPLEFDSTGRTALTMGVIPEAADVGEMRSKLEAITDTLIFREVSADKDMRYIAAVSLKEHQEEILALFKQYGFSQISLSGFTGTAAENIARIGGECENVKKEIEELKKKVEENAMLKNGIEEYSDVLTMRLDQEKIKSKLLRTKKAFFAEGWLPEKAVGKATEILEENGCVYNFRDPEEGEEVPVLLSNPSFFKPVESITEMYSLPAYTGFDPTSIYAMFYVVFFGLMFSDACYGLIMTAVCFFALKKYDLEGTMHNMVKLFLYCGISTFFWGVMFGGWFGDFFSVFSRTILGKEFVINPVWFDPIKDPITLLIFSLVLGVIHLFTAMGIKVYIQCKRGEYLDAFCDEGLWYIVLIGIFALLLGDRISPTVPVIGKWMAILGGIGLALAGMRGRKGLGRLVGAFSNLYNITSWISDILSYSRILALGLATGVIAQVVNTMGSMFGNGVVKLIIMIVVFIVGQVLNFAINVLGAFIHASRLQYVEFFGKFYEDGGQPFEPFRRNTKYIKFDGKA